MEIDKSELVAASYGFYMQLIRSNEATVREKLQARKQADDLLGLQAPSRVALTDTEGNDQLRPVVEVLINDRGEAEQFIEFKELLKRHPQVEGSTAATVEGKLLSRPAIEETSDEIATPDAGGESEEVAGDSGGATPPTGETTDNMTGDDPWKNLGEEVEPEEGKG